MEKELCEVKRGRVSIAQPGSEANPFIFEKLTFADMSIEIGAGHVEFRECKFDRCPVKGHSSFKHEINVMYGDPSPPINPRLMKPAGTFENPLVFHGVRFCNAKFDMGAVHAVFDQCVFAKCDLEGFSNCLLRQCWFLSTSSETDTQPYIFQVKAEDMVLYGRISATTTAATAAAKWLTAIRRHKFR
jgi:hypothetical protein